jgi:glutamine amidotransferase PdxT
MSRAGRGPLPLRAGPPALVRDGGVGGLCAGHLMIAGANPNTNNLLANLEILSCKIIRQKFSPQSSRLALELEFDIMKATP